MKHVCRDSDADDEHDRVNDEIVGGIIEIILGDSSAPMTGIPVHQTLVPFGVGTGLL